MRTWTSYAGARSAVEAALGSGERAPLPLIPPALEEAVEQLESVEQLLQAQPECERHALDRVEALIACRRYESAVAATTYIKASVDSLYLRGEAHLRLANLKLVRPLA